jgi:capsular polysaccharide transport system ATP-binding protein
MLSVRGLSKTYPSPSGVRVLFEDLSFDLPRGGRLAVLGRNGQGKSTLIKILGGALWPSTGRINWDMEGSWPMAFTGAFQGGLTGLDNIRFISRIYRRPVDEIIANTEGFAQLGDALFMPVKHYSTGMRARLAFGLSLAIEFDCYLIDEVISVGDVLFQKKCQSELFDVRADRAFIMATHDMDLARRTCDRALIIEGGRAKMFDDIEQAIEVYSALDVRLGFENGEARPVLQPLSGALAQPLSQAPWA